MPTVIYDPECLVCRGFCRWVAGKGNQANVEFVAPDSAIEAGSIVWLNDTGERIEGSKAVLLAISTRRGFAGTVASSLAHLPIGPFLDPLYYYIARNRSKISSFLLKVKRQSIR